MKLIFYELKKLVGPRYVCVILCIFVAANFICALSAAEASYSTKDAELVEFYKEYFTDRQEMDKYYEAILEYERLNSPSVGSDGFVDREEIESVESAPLPNRYSKTAYISDKELFELLYAEISSAENYSSDIKVLIKEAQTNLSEYPRLGIYPDSYTYKYQEKMIEVYSNIQNNVSIGVEHSRGWSGLFTYGTANIFIFASILLIGTLSFAQEGSTGFDIILRVSKKGRFSTGATKLSAMALISIGITTIFTASTFCAFALNGGFSSASNAIQSISEFRYAPYILTIGQYFVISFIVRMLVFLLFGMITSVLSVVFRQYILIYASGSMILGVSFIIHTLANKTNTSALYLNIVSAVDSIAFFDHFRSINVFSSAISLDWFAITVGSILMISYVLIALALYCNGKLGFFSIRLKKAVFSVKKRKKNIKCRILQQTLFSTEYHKTFVASRLGILTLCLLIISVFTSYRSYPGIDSFGDRVYHDYMEELEGAPSADKDGFIMAERSEIMSIVSARNARENAYKSGQIGREEYLNYLDSYNTAQAKSDYLKLIEEHRVYLAAKSAAGQEAWYLYDSGWLTLFSSGGDAFCFSAIVILFCGVFSREYNSASSSGRFAYILRTTKKGRGLTFTAKFLSSLIISALLFVIFYLPQIIFVFNNYYLPAAEAPLASIRTYTMYTGKLTVGDYAILLFFMRFCGVIILGILSTTISCICERELTAICMTVGLTVLPSLAASWGLKTVQKISFWELFSGNTLFINSIAYDTFGSDYGFVTLFITICTIICIFLIFISYKKWCKGKYISFLC